MKSVEYIEETILMGVFDEDPYSLNVAAFALAVAKRNQIFQVLGRRDRLMVHEGTYE